MQIFISEIKTKNFADKVYMHASVSSVLWSSHGDNAEKSKSVLTWVSGKTFKTTKLILFDI